MLDRTVLRLPITLAILAAMVPSLMGQTPSTWNGGSGAWSDPLKWSSGVPNAASADAIIDNLGGTNSVITVDSAFTLGRLRIDTGDRVEFGAGSTSITMLDTGFTGAGEMLLNGTLVIPGSADNNGSSQMLSGPKTLNGTGKLQLGSPGRRPAISGTTTNNATIEGTGEFGRGNNSSYFDPILNAGMVNANMAGEALRFNTFNSTNTGTMKATNGAVLHFAQGSMNGSGGQIIADGAGSVVQFGGGNDFTVTGGNLSTLNGGLIQTGNQATWKNLTNSGAVQSGGVLILDGTVTNNGVITISGAQRRVDAPANPGFDPAKTVTLAGTGEVILDKPPSRIDTAFADQSTRWLIQGQTIRGRGSFGRNSSGGTEPQVTNRGAFQADRNGEVLELALSSLDNQSGGVLRARDGGILQLGVGGPLLNTGGTIEALTGGQIVSSFGRIHGGLIRNVGGSINLNGMTLFNPGSGMTLQGVLTVASNETMRLVNGIANEGTLRIRSTGIDSIVYIGEDGATTATLTGNGDIKLGDDGVFTGPASIRENYPGSTLTIADNLIHGFGTVGTNNRQLSIVNQDTIRADVSGKTLFVKTSTFNNTQGLLQAENGGILDLSSATPIANVGSVIEAKTGGTVQFSGGTEVSGGTLINNGVTFNLGNSGLINPGSGMTLKGAFVLSNDLAARLVGTIRNEGTIRLRSSSVFSNYGGTTIVIGNTGAPNVSLIGGGNLILGDPALGGTSARVDAAMPDASLTIGAVGEAQTLSGFGVVGFGFNNSTRWLHVTNNDLINADATGQTLAFVPITLTNSPGKVMKATNGGSLYFNPVSLTNTGATIQATKAGGPSTVIFDATSIAGGVVNSEAPAVANNFTTGGTIQILNGLTARGGIIFANAGATIIGGGNGGTQDFLGLNDGGSTFINGGNVTKVGSGDYSMYTSLNDTGSMLVGSGILRWFGGGTIANASFSAAVGAHLTFQGAQPYTFSGTNTLNGPGQHWVAGTAALADSATVLTTRNFNFYNSALSGPGTISFSGALNFAPYNNSSFSGAKLLNLAGSTAFLDTAVTLNFTNAAQWENRGLLTMSGYVNTINGDDTTLFTNTASGVLRGAPAQTNDFIMPFRNAGIIDVTGGILHLKKNGTFANGAATIANGTQLYLENSVLTLEGQANTSTGLGFFQVVGTASLALTPGAKFSADKLQFNNSSSAVGTGVVDVAKDLRFHPYYSAPAIMDGVRFNTGATSTGLIQFDGGLLRFQNGASLRNAGNMEIRASSALELNSGALFENSGILRIYDSPTFAGDGTGLFRTLAGSETRFYTSRTVNWPIEFAGQLFAENGTTVTFNKGGLFNQTAKISVPLATSNVTFTGAVPFRARGVANEFPGLGYVNFVDTTLQFEDADPNTPAVEPSSISAGARVTFQGTNNTVSGDGTLGTTGFVFQSGNVTVNGATLATSGTADTTVWNATGGSLTLLNGARFLNDARFVIQSSVGSITGDAATLFHNKSNGRLVHDTSTTTNFDVPFLNDGFLEFRSGTFNFLKSFKGTGGIAASNGAKVNLSLAGVAGALHPTALETTGLGSQINVTLAAGQVLSLNINLNGGRMVAAGGLNMVAAGGMNMVAAGGGNLVAAGGMNLVAAGGGNATSTGAASLIQANNLVAAGAGNILSHNGGTMVAAGSLNADGGTVKADGIGSRIDAATMVAAGAGNILSHNGGTMVAAGSLNADGGKAEAKGAGSIIRASSMVAAGAGNLVGLDGGTMVAAGGGNILSHNGGVMVAAGGGNIKIQAGASFASASFKTASSAPPPAGKIIAGSNGTIKGDGTYTGAGEIQSGGFLKPGMSPGTLTWNGDLNIQNGGNLEIELSGTTAGTQYDVLNVSGALIADGVLQVRFVNGFQSTVQSSHVFNVATAGSAITGTLDNLRGGRVGTLDAVGSFAVQFTNSGKTLTLSDFQPPGITFANWAAQKGLTGNNALPTADPDFDGLSNFLEYALGLNPTSASRSPILSGLLDVAGQLYLTMTYPRPAGADARLEITYVGERSISLAPLGWSPSGVIEHSITPEPGGLMETVILRSTTSITPSLPEEFLHLKVSM